MGNMSRVLFACSSRAEKSHQRMGSCFLRLDDDDDDEWKDREKPSEKTSSPGCGRSESRTCVRWIRNSLSFCSCFYRLLIALFYWPGCCDKMCFPPDTKRENDSFFSPSRHSRYSRSAVHSMSGHPFAMNATEAFPDNQSSTLVSSSFIHYLQWIYIPCLALLGICGNLICAVVFTTKSLRSAKARMNPCASIELLFLDTFARRRTCSSWR